MKKVRKLSQEKIDQRNASKSKQVMRKERGQLRGTMSGKGMIK